MALTNEKSMSPSPRSSTDRPKDLAFRSIVQTIGLIERVMQPYFAKFDISGSQWSVLRTIYRAESEGLPGLRLTDLSKRLVVRPPSITGVIDRLERLGMVTRASVPGDMRVKQVALTPKSRQLVERVLLAHPGQIDAVLDGLTSAEHEEMYRLSTKLNMHLEKLVDGPNHT
jgi:DNA-binding MarR family transcriptional regulator